MENNFLPKWISQTLAILLIIFIAFLTLNQIKTIKGTPQTLSLSAEGKVIAIPDLAIVTLGVLSEGMSPIEVKNKNNQKINQIIAYIKQQGISTNDIQTTTFYASPKYNYLNGQNNLVGYQANQTITVKIKNIDQSQTQLEKILDGVVNNGANQIQGIQFNFMNIEKYQQLARKQAIEKAKLKAKELATDANLKLGKIINLIESDHNSPNPIRYATANFTVKINSTPADIEPGNQEITEMMTVVFEIH